MLRIVLLCCLLTASLLAQASEGDKYNRVDIQYTQPADVARQLNTALSNALGKAAVFRTIEIQ